MFSKASKLLFATILMIAEILGLVSAGFAPIPAPGTREIRELDIEEDPKGTAIYVPIVIGKPSKGGTQQFWPQIDTGSCNLVVPHKGCESCNSDHKYSSLKYTGTVDL
jgi:hypothetical protein